MPYRAVTSTQDYAAISRLGVMNFLSEVALDFPDAVSFASGRPNEAFFDFDAWMDAMQRFRRSDARRRSSDAITSGRRLAQYGPTKGIVNAAVAEQLGRDQGVTCTPEQVVVTNGAQEALALCLQVLCRQPSDVVIARNPTYIGLTGAATLAGIPLVALETSHDETIPEAFARTLRSLDAERRRVRVLYLIPEFDNPTGEVLQAADRAAISHLCAERKIVILEDDPYGMFRFEGTPSRPIAAQSDDGTVIYLGTYSKTLCPAVRVGCAVVPRTIFGSVDAARAMVSDLCERKSFLSVNTSQFNQALLGGVLDAEGGSLQRLVRPALEYYRSNRNVLIERLASSISDPRVRWNKPEGGFFLTIDLPFVFDAPEMVRCARDYGTIAMPMSFFALDGSQQHRARLSFSNVSTGEIALGIQRFAAYIDDHLTKEDVRAPHAAHAG